MTSRRQVILFAGGGSGGHISPGLAIAERLTELDPSAQSIFACSNRKIDATMLSQAGAEFHAMPAAPLSLRPAALVRFLVGYRQTIQQAAQLIRDKSVTQVVALGGFVAAPVVSASRRCGIPVTLVNLDAPPGKANRMMARRCTRVLSAIPTPTHPNFASQIVGLPVRRRAIAPADSAACRIKLGLDADLPMLLVTGASQGSRSINQLIPALAETQPDVFRGWQVLHLAGAGDDGPIRQAYAKAGVRATVLEFLHEMGLAWGAAELAVTRAGANSVAEVAINAVPAVFLPYPHHHDQHQRFNAQPLVDRGVAVLAQDHVEIEANLRGAGAVIIRLMNDSATRSAMRNSLKAAQPDDAAMAIAKLLLHEAV